MGIRWKKCFQFLAIMNDDAQWGEQGSYEKG